jgi:hypothetical protein
MNFFWRMLMRSTLIIAAAASAAIAIGAGAAEAKSSAGGECFLSNDWKGWTITAGGDALLLRINLHDIYRVDLTPGSHARRNPGEFLVNRVRGSSWICSSLDLDLTISDDLGFRRPLIATGLRKLTPQEVAAIPRKELP